MRAVLVTRFGAPDVLEVGELERPSPISTEVLVRVIAAGVNPVDCKTRRGEGVARWVGPPPFVVGWDVCGVVESMGYGVTRFAAGDLVYGMPRFPRAAGGYAEFVTAPSRQLARAPDGLSAVEAAALPLAALTAWRRPVCSRRRSRRRGQAQGGNSRSSRLRTARRAGRSSIGRNLQARGVGQPDGGDRRDFRARAGRGRSRAARTPRPPRQTCP